MPVETSKKTNESKSAPRNCQICPICQKDVWESDPEIMCNQWFHGRSLIISAEEGKNIC